MMKKVYNDLRNTRAAAEASFAGYSMHDAVGVLFDKGPARFASDAGCTVRETVEMLLMVMAPPLIVLALSLVYLVK